MRERLAWMVAAACALLAACATGVDSGDDGALGAGDSGVTVEASPGTGREAAAAGGQDGAMAVETGSPTSDAGPGGDDSSPADDAPSTEEAAATQDAAMVQDTGAAAQDTGSGQDTGTTSGGQCSGAAKYDIEAVAEIASGTITLCLGGVCGAGQCCFEGLSPGNVCVAE